MREESTNSRNSSLSSVQRIVEIFKNFSQNRVLPIMWIYLHLKAQEKYIYNSQKFFYSVENIQRYKKQYASCKANHT